MRSLGTEIPVVAQPVPVEIVLPQDLSQDPDVRGHQKALAIVNYQRAIREAQRPLGWEQGLAELGGDVQTLKEQSVSLEERVDELGGLVPALMERLVSLEERVTELASRVYTIPTGLRNRKCPNCAKEGLVAYYIRCTSCNSETWWGWYPPKSGAS